MRLKDLQIKKLSPGKGTAKQKTYFDEGLKGFGVRVSVGGTKSFVVMHGRSRRLRTLGRYPDLTLAEARIEAKKSLAKLQAELLPKKASCHFHWRYNSSLKTREFAIKLRPMKPTSEFLSATLHSERKSELSPGKM